MSVSERRGFCLRAKTSLSIGLLTITLAFLLYQQAQLRSEFVSEGWLAGIEN